MLLDSDLHKILVKSINHLSLLPNSPSTFPQLFPSPSRWMAPLLPTASLDPETLVFHPWFYLFPNMQEASQILPLRYYRIHLFLCTVICDSLGTGCTFSLSVLWAPNWSSPLLCGSCLNLFSILMPEWYFPTKIWSCCLQV